jgi:peptidoglycan/LPS O-acetylase OafA/YrhL
MAANPARLKSHVPELDGIRGVSILLVMGLHFICSQIENPQNKLEYLAARITGFGAWGVDAFFVLSGFLITGILWDSRGNDHYFRTFYIRRTLRIFPLYYATLAVLVLFPLALAGEQAPRLVRIREVQEWLWFYLTNVYVAQQGNFTIPYVSHFWTLAIEEHFYLFWPFVVGLLPRATVMRVSLAAAAAAVILRIFCHYAAPNPLYAHVLTPCRLDALTIGAWFALAARGPGGMSALGQKARLGAVVGALGVLGTSGFHSVVGVLDGVVMPLRELFLALFFGFVIVLASNAEGPVLLRAALRTRPLVLLGKYSYGLYVFHGMIGYGFAKNGTIAFFEELVGSRTLGYAVQAAFGSVLSIAIAVASYELFESRFLRLKDSFPSNPRGVVPPPLATEPAPEPAASSRTS